MRAQLAAFCTSGGVRRCERCDWKRSRSASLESSRASGGCRRASSRKRPLEQGPSPGCASSCVFATREGEVACRQGCFGPIRFSSALWSSCRSRLATEPLSSVCGWARRGVASARAVKRTVVAITLIFLGFAGLAALGLTGNLVVAVALVVAYVFVTAALTVVRGFRRSRRAGVGR